MAIYKDGRRQNIIGAGELGPGETIDGIDISEAVEEIYERLQAIEQSLNGANPGEPVGQAGGGLQGFYPNPQVRIGLLSTLLEARAQDQIIVETHDSNEKKNASLGSLPLFVPYRTISHLDSPANILSTDGILYVDSVGGPVTIVLPDSLLLGGQMFIVKDTGFAGTHPITIAPETAFLDGSGENKTLGYNSQAIGIHSDGSNWFIF